MRSAQDKFTYMKEQLTRLNEVWSLTGETFCHQAAMHIRQAIWNEKDIVSSIRPLMLAVCSLQRRYAKHVDPDTMPESGPGSDYAVERWNQTFTATAYILDELESFLSQKERDTFNRETIEAYKRSV